MKKVIIIDVGTHLGQELSLFQEGYLKRLILAFIKEAMLSIKAPRSYSLPSIVELIESIRNLRLIHSADIKTISIEPNFRLYGSKVYKKADRVFAAGISKGDKVELMPLFLTGPNKKGQGSSIFMSKTGVQADNFDIVTIIGVEKMADMINDIFCLTTSDIVVLRINAEGVEDDVIYGLNKKLNSRISLVMGSLKDVMDLKGKSAHDDLVGYLKKSNIAFVPLSPLYSSWYNAFKQLNQIVC